MTTRFGAVCAAMTVAAGWMTLAPPALAVVPVAPAPEARPEKDIPPPPVVGPQKPPPPPVLYGSAPPAAPSSKAEPAPIGVAAPADTSAAANSKLGSVYVRCDGDPANHSPAEIAGRLLLIMASSGLVGGGETSNDARRLTGAEGVAACDAAIADETDPTRRVQLALARVVHRIENQDFVAALAEAKAAPAFAADRAGERAFAQSLAVSALELQAAALVRLDRIPEAEEAALTMAEAAPFDLVTQQRALRYLQLTGDLGPRKAAFFDRYARLYPLGLLTAANAREWAGDYAGSDAGLEAMSEVYRAFLGEDFVDETPLLTARQAIAQALAGDVAASEATAADARAAVDKLADSEKATASTGMIAQTEELLDFHGIVRRLAEGKAAEARTIFTARSRWTAPTAAAVAEVATRLRKDARPAELTGMLAREPQAIRAEALAARVRALTDPAKTGTTLYAAIRPALKAAHYKGYSRTVWKTAKSPYILKRPATAKYVGETIYVGNPYAGALVTPEGEALLLHAALVAKARGKSGFMIGPGRKRMDSATLLFGNPGDIGFPTAAVLDAATVIAALSPDIPEPVKGQ